MNYEGLLELVKSRRSIRSFKQQPVPDEYIDKLIEVARWAPSARNAQPWEFVIVKEKELREKIVQLFMESVFFSHKMELSRPPEERFPLLAKEPKNRPGFAEAPVLIVPCADPRAVSPCPLSVTLEYAPRLSVADITNVCLYIHLAATTLGLASQYLTFLTTSFAACQLKSILRIPESWEIHHVIAIGFPAAEPTPRPVRERTEMVHYDYCDKIRTDEEIREFEEILRRWWSGEAWF